MAEEHFKFEDTEFKDQGLGEEFAVKLPVLLIVLD